MILEEFYGGFNLFDRQLDPLTPQLNQWDLQTGKLCELGLCDGPIS